MDKIFKPDSRKWITPSVKLRQKGLELQEMATKPLKHISEQGLEFMPPPTSQEKLDEEQKRKEAEGADRRNLASLILKELPKKKSGRTAEEVPEEIDKINQSLANMAKIMKEFDSANIDYSDSEDGDEEEEGFGLPTTTDDESSRSAEYDKEQTEICNAKNENGPSCINQEAEEVLQELKMKTDSNATDVTGGSNVTAVIALDHFNQRDKKNDAEFSVFYEYNHEKVREREKQAIRDEEEYHMATGLNKDTYLDLARRTSSLLAFDKHEVFVDDSVTQGVEMPLLAGPVPHQAVRSLNTLALYTSLSDEPGTFQWKSTQVMEQLTANQQVEKQLMREYQRKGRRMKKMFPQGEFILTVSFYQPSKLATYDLKIAPDPKPGLEIEVLGSHTLEDLRQQFFCQRNYACTKGCRDFKKWTTINEAMERFGTDLAMNVIKGHMIFIGDSCFTDGSQEAKDHFKNVMYWIKDLPNNEIGEFIEKPLSTKIADLEIRFGYPYMYLHQGDCEHIVVFTALRLPRPVEFQTFPRHEIVGKYPSLSCRIDKAYLARWVVSGSDRFPENPILLCNKCVEQYCLTKLDGKRGDGGKKVGEFKLYPYLQITAFI